MKIYNSRTREKETFIPMHEGKIGIYVCGPTVYNYFHVGNARAFLTFDVLRRYFVHRGYDVTYVQNFTDIDDKMIRRAKEEGTTVQQVAERYIAAYHEDAAAIGIIPADIEPRATEHIPQIIALIQRLIDKGLAYASGGDVYYRVHAFPCYGCLSGQDIEALEAGASERVCDGEELQKEDALDFALWKAQKEGEPAWESPWGLGRPGWHIECSAMSMHYLGDTIDIHCGGSDLVFPHHENEVAQSEGATGQPYVRYWMHNGFINIDNEKMSKSKGNFFTLRDIAKEYDLEAVRMFLLSAHYRSPINFSREQIAQAQAALTRLYIARDQLLFLAKSAPERPLSKEEEAFSACVKESISAFDAAMEDDFNTADAIAALFELVRQANTALGDQSPKALVEETLTTLESLASILGILCRKEDAIPTDIQALVERRVIARKERNWQQSDALRDEISALGYTVEDTPQGPKVRKMG